MPTDEKKPLVVESKTEVMLDEKLVNAAPVAPPAQPAPSDRASKLTFSMYMAVRNVPLQRQAGMRHFTKLTEATLAEWDAAFRKY